MKVVIEMPPSDGGSVQAKTRERPLGSGHVLLAAAL
jgi:hypothetical protein